LKLRLRYLNTTAIHGASLKET